MGLRAGTENVTGAVGFAKAVELAEDKEHVKKMTELNNQLINTVLEKIPHTKLNGPKDNRLCNNANISFSFIEGESLLMHLDMIGIAVSTASACSSKSLKPSHVLKAIGLRTEIAHGAIRFTLSRYTTKEEINHTLEKLIEVVGKLRELSPLNESNLDDEYDEDHEHDE